MKALIVLLISLMPFFVQADENILPPGVLRDLNLAVSGKTLIGLGEAEHGTHEINKARVEIIIHLLSQPENSINSILIETQDSALQPLRDYIARGECNSPTPDEIGTMFDGWRDVNSANLIEWLCKNRPGIEVRGFDTQSVSIIEGILGAVLATNPSQDWLQVFAFHLNHCPYAPNKASSIVELEQLYGKYRRAFFDQSFTPVATADELSSRREHCIRSIEIARELLVEPDSSSQLERDLNTFQEVNESWFLLMPEADFIQRFRLYGESRDSYMAKNLKSAVREYGGRALLWAHSGHLAKRTSLVSEIQTELPSGIKMLGEWLDQEFGDSYTAISITSSDIKMRCSMRYPYCRSEEEFPAPGYGAEPQQFVESLIGRALQGPAYVPTSGNVVGQILEHNSGSPQICRGVGNCNQPSIQYDGFIFLEQVNGVRFFR